MATLVLQTVGSVVGGIAGPIGSTLGRLISGVGGALADAALQPHASPRLSVGPRLKSMDGISSTEGAAIARVYGRARIGGQMIWATRFLEQASVSLDGGSGGRGKGGGGAVFLTDGCVCVALRFRRNPEWAIADYFAAGNGLVASALREAFGIAAGTRGVSDLAVGDKKIAGSSLYLPRQCGVYLASILVNMRLGDLDRYLRHPSREPDYRGRRAHADFVANLADLPGAAGATPESARALATLAETVFGWKAAAASRGTSVTL